MKIVYAYLLLSIGGSLHAETACAQPVVSAGSMPDAALHARIDALLVNVKSSLRYLKGGTFEMGDWGNGKGQHYDIDPWSRPLHKVTLDSFSMAAYKVTYDDFDVFTDATGNERINMEKFNVENRAPKRPAGVSWYGANEYCAWLGKMTGLPFALPTEAQWEYAARSGGRRMLFATDNGNIERGRNFPEEWKDGPEPSLPDVGTYPPNPAGLYGMSENTYEWVNDWFDEEYYKKSENKNPNGPSTGTKKVMRGSVGGKAEIAAMVFMRTKHAPQIMHTMYTYTDESEVKENLVPFAGYSGYSTTNFRCIINNSKAINYTK